MKKNKVHTIIVLVIIIIIFLMILSKNNGKPIIIKIDKNHLVEIDEKYINVTDTTITDLV
jgi:hypothetical protein